MSSFQPKHVLCPIDFSEHSAAALRVAGGIAKAFGARVVVLHAQRLEVPVYFTKAQTQALKAQLRRSARAAWGFVNDFALGHLPEGVEHSVLLMEDEPVRSVLTVQNDLRAGLVVMGTHGRTGLARLRLGSVMESVLRQTFVPVLTVGPRIRPSPSLATIRRVLCPVNYTDLARAALDHAAVLAERTKASLIVAHVLEGAAERDERSSLQQLCDWVSADVPQPLHGEGGGQARKRCGANRGRSKELPRGLNRCGCASPKFPRHDPVWLYNRAGDPLRTLPGDVGDLQVARPAPVSRI